MVQSWRFPAARSGRMLEHQQLGLQSPPVACCSEQLLQHAPTGAAVEPWGDDGARERWRATAWSTNCMGLPNGEGPEARKGKRDEKRQMARPNEATAGIKLANCSFLFRDLLVVDH